MSVEINGAMFIKTTECLGRLYPAKCHLDEGGLSSKCGAASVLRKGLSVISSAPKKDIQKRASTSPSPLYSPAPPSLFLPLFLHFLHTKKQNMLVIDPPPPPLKNRNKVIRKCEKMFKSQKVNSEL